MFQWAELIPLTEYFLLTLFSPFSHVSKREELVMCNILFVLEV